MRSLSLFEQHRRAGPSFCQEAHRGESMILSVEGALQTIAEYGAMHAIRKGQIRWLPKGMCRSGPIHPPDPRYCCLIDHRSRRFNPRPLHSICDRSYIRHSASASGAALDSSTGTGLALVRGPKWSTSFDEAMRRATPLFRAFRRFALHSCAPVERY
jgi:hypothetical protein